MTDPRDPATVQRVVVRAPNWLGDAVLSLPALAGIRLRFPKAELTVAAVAGVAPLFREETHTGIDHVVDLPAGTRDAVATLEGGGFDAGILFPNSFRSAWQFWRAGIAHRWGYATSARRPLLTRVSRRPRRRGVVHQVEYYRQLVDGLDMTADVGDPRIAARGPSAARGAALLAQHGVASGAVLVGFAPGAAYGQAKQWPPERVARVIEQLLRREGAVPILVGAAHDRDASRAIESWFRVHAPDLVPRLVNLTGRTSLGALVGLIERMAAFVSNDSGAMHLAAALGRPVVALFGPTDERVTRPLGDHDVMKESVFCRPCLLRDCPIDHRCMKRISVDAVYTAVSRRLARGVAR